MDLSKPQVGASSSSSSSSIHSLTHDVFLSFRGPDTRNNFTSFLHRNLVDKGIKTFIDNDLTRGEDITEELLKVIEGSRISIVVFSANYASSKWCLDELVKIIQCKESKHQIVYPIFYKVDLSEIRYQKGQVGEQLAHLSRYVDNLKKMESWKAALTQAATLSGWPISDGGNEANIIGEIVKLISTNITKSTLLHVATCPVGIESRVKDILKLLNVGQDNPHRVGIWGIGGIGKSILAKAVYNSISNKFEHSCFLANVREESSSSGGLVKLQNNFLKNIERDLPNVENVAEGITLLKQKLSQKRVLLVIDDVDCLGQLEAFAAESGWFGPGSKIIITTRDTNLLSSDSTYEVKELNHEDASKLFNFYAFKGDTCPDGFFELATEVIHYAKGIPLVLEVLGSDLCSKKDEDEWKDAIGYYHRYPNQQIQRALKRSYEGLEDRIKEVFLHIACFFKGYVRSYVIDVLQSCDLNPKYALKVLTEKALIKIEKDNWIWMHDLIEDMGKEIVRQESRDEIGQRSRLWLYEDVREVLEENKGTDKIKAIVLKSVWNSQKIQLNGGSFTNLKNLQIFKVDAYEMLSGESVDYLPNQLRVLDWFFCSLRSLPTDFNPTKLGMLQISGPCTTPLVNERLKKMLHLKSIHLWDCDRVTRIPDLSGLTCLKDLNLSQCRDLVEVDPSVGRLDKLVYLRLSHCKKLQMFQERINLKSLETLDLSDCPLEFFPEIEGDMKSLKSLNLSKTAIKELPCSVKNLTGLKYLSLHSCHNLTDVPLIIFYGLQRLEKLDLEGCYNLVTFPTKSESLPPPQVFSTNLTSRLQVRLDGCDRLEEISEFPREIDSLYVNGCESLKRISKLSKILEGKDSKMFGELDLTDCWRLRNDLALAKKKRTKKLMREADKLTALLTLFFSCAKSEEFQVTFPARALLPNWFTCRQDVNWDVTSDEDEDEDVTLDEDEDEDVTSDEDEDVDWDVNREHEFCIEIPQNSNWDNKGLALCIQWSSAYVTHFVYINGIKFDEKIMYGKTVWVHYIPLVTVIRRLSECGMPPPDMFRVMFRFHFTGHDYPSHSISGEVSWGVHLIENLERTSKLSLVNEGFKNLQYLKSVRLWGCDDLTRIPDLSGLTSLEYLELSFCDDLVEVHPSVGRLDKLVILKLSWCEKLQMFQKRINMKSLETLDLSGCSQLKFFPEIEGDMRSLNRLDLSRTDIKELPCSVGNLTGLKSLSLNSCHNLTNVPSSIFYGLQHLEKLDLGYCSNLVTFPTKSESLPPPVFSTNLTRLQVHLDHCTRLEEISEFPREIDFLSVESCWSLKRISKLSKILEGKDSKMFGRLDLTDCDTLCDNLARGVVSEVEVAKKREKMTSEQLMGEAEKLTALLNLFFSCAKSEEFQVHLPASAPIPNWFTITTPIVKTEEIKEHEFCIEIPHNSDWDSNGLALCIESCFCQAAGHFVYINGIKFDEIWMSADEVWVHYIPLVTVIRRLSECGVPPPDMFQVMFRFESSECKWAFGGSWGVHLIKYLEGEGR